MAVVDNRTNSVRELADLVEIVKVARAELVAQERE